MPDTLATNAWTKITLAECCDEIAQRIDNPAESGFDRFVGLEHLKSGETSIRNWGSTDDVTSSMKLFKASDVIVARRNVYLRRAARADFDGVCSGDGIVLRGNPKVCLLELLPFLLNTDGFWAYVTSQADGTMSKRITVKRLLAYRFALPPLKEQRRIAEVLQASDRQENALRQLARACDGTWIPLFRELTGLKTPADELAIISGDAARTSTGCEVQSVRDLCTSDRQGVQVGPFGGSVSSKHFAAEGTPVFKINNITERGDLDLNNVVYLNEQQANSLSERYAIRAGDLLTAAQATVGRTAIADERIDGAIISQHIIRISVDENLCLPAWMHACFSSPLVLRQIYAAVQGGTRAGLNTTDVAEIVVPVLELSEQAKACSEFQRIRDMSQSASARAAACGAMPGALLEQLQELA